VLAERFHANAEFEAIYEEKLGELRSELFDSGVADEIVDTWVDTLNAGAAEFVAEDTLASEAEAIREQFGD
jgi:spore coat protein CotH